MKLIDALREQTQIDEYGEMCGVSRQAVDEAIIRLQVLEARAKELEAKHDRLNAYCAKLDATNARLREVLKNLINKVYGVPAFSTLAVDKAITDAMEALEPSE